MSVTPSTSPSPSPSHHGETTYAGAVTHALSQGSPLIPEKKASYASLVEVGSGVRLTRATSHVAVVSRLHELDALMRTAEAVIDRDVRTG